MLSIKVKKNSVILLGDEITIKVDQVNRGQAYLLVEAPESINIEWKNPETLKDKPSNKVKD